MVAAVQLPGLVLERPWGVLALLAPALVWWLAARRGRPPEAWTGTLAVWHEALGGQPREERRSRRLPPAVRLLVAALVAGALALCGPHAARASSGRTWTVVVDRSPSMYLPWRAPGLEPAGQTTRLGRALELAGEALDVVRANGDRVVWLTYEDGELAREGADSIPAAWLASPATPQAQPPWSAHDRPGVVWLSDGTPSPPAREAGLALSGGEPVPGPVAALGTTRVEWDGERLQERPDAGSRPAVLLGAAVGGPVERVVRAWAEARGVAAVAERSAQVVLELVVTQGADVETGAGAVLACGRDGWWWEVTLLGEDAGPGETWLAADPAGTRTRVVTWQPGRIALAPGRYEEEPEGDPADFALSWAELLDRAAAPPAGVVSLAERRGAGIALVRAPAPPGPSVPAGAGLPAALLSALAAGLALAALSARRR